MTTNLEKMREFATRYTAAWCSQNAASVAAFYALNGSLCINGGIALMGRGAIAEAAQGFMTAFPDLQIVMDDLVAVEEGFVYHWTLIGTNSGLGGKGRRVRISGCEEWKIGADGLIAESKGKFDDIDYQRQIE